MFRRRAETPDGRWLSLAADHHCNHKKRHLGQVSGITNDTPIARDTNLGGDVKA
jgi:hypothetical protein